MPARRSAPLHELPEGFVYAPNFIAEEEETALLESIRDLQFRPFEFQGYLAKRRIAEFGLEYNFATRKASGTNPLPSFLNPLRDRAAVFAQINPAEIAEAIATEYPPEAPMGWHRDVPQFEIIIGVSLGSECWMRLKPFKADGKVLSILLEPRSIYIMQGVARWQFQHSIVPVKSLRYSVTFRTMRLSSRKP